MGKISVCDKMLIDNLRKEEKIDLINFVIINSKQS